MNKSFGITIRPKCGVNEVDEINIINYCRKHKHQVIAEKMGNERHLHIQLWFDEPRRKGHVKQAFERICEKYDWWDADHKRHCIKVKLCYNDWIINYCIDNDNKNDPYDELSIDIPPVTGGYYPTDEEQQKMIEKNGSMNQKLYMLKELYIHEFSKVTMDNVALFLGELCYLQDKVVIPTKKVDRVNLCTNLYWYLKAQIDTSVPYKEFLKC